MNAIKLLGIKITPGTMEEHHGKISRLIAGERRGIILCANIHGLNLAHKYSWLANFYTQADIVYVDGAGVVLGAKLLGHNIPKRTTMADWGWPAAVYLAEHDHSLFLLGSLPGVTALAAERLKAHAPRLKILGTHHGFFNKEGAENSAVIGEINRLQPDILMVGMGMPLEQRWILENYQKIQAKVFWEVGAAFEYWAGLVRRCPRWMGEWGLEWLFRLLLEPRRMAKRYLWGNPVFILNILGERWGLLKV